MAEGHLTHHITDVTFLTPNPTRLALITGAKIEGYDEDWPALSTWPEGYSVTITLDEIDLRVVSIMTNIPLVDLSIEWEPHLVRGTE